MTKELTSAQRDELTSQYVEIVVDNMDTKDLVRYAIEQLTSYSVSYTHLTLPTKRIV